MSIHKSDPRLTAYAFDELSEPEKLEFEAELGDSQSARDELSDIQRTLSDLRSEFAESAPQRLDAHRRAEIEAAVRAGGLPKRRDRRRRVLAGFSLAAVAASVVLFAVDGAQNESPSEETAAGGAVTYRLTGKNERGVARDEHASGAPRPVASGPSPRTGREFARKSDIELRDGRTSRESAVPGDPFAVPPQADVVKAGEWDDNANYREFTRWLSTDVARGAHFMDLSDRRFIVVRDRAGHGVPACKVVIEDDSDRRTELVTAASGRAILFPHAEGLSGRSLTASTTCGSGARASFRLTQGDGVVELRLATERVLGERSIDVAFILDSTGSMREEIRAVQATIQKVATSLRDSNVRIRVGLVEFKDRGDPYVTKVFPMSDDLALFARQVAGVSAGGGGDLPESVNEALHVGIEQLAWDADAFAKLAFLIGDAPPHLDYAQDYDYALEAREAAHRGIQVFTVAASGMDTLGQVVWRQVAAFTGATNLFVLRGGAGPQSAGAGNPMSSCGGTQTAYTSGNLDLLIVAKVESAMRALDRDPLRIPGLHQDENAKPCGKRILVQ